MAAAVAPGNAGPVVKTALERAAESVGDLLAFRDHYFESHDLREAAMKWSRVEQRRAETLRLLTELEGECGDRAGYLALRGRALNAAPAYAAEAEAALARAVKLRPALVAAWNDLGDVYWKKGDVAAAASCFEGALAHCRNKVSLRSLSMLLRQRPRGDEKETSRLVMDSVLHAKDAVAMDTADGTSWYILGNAYFSLFFVTSQEPRILQLSLNAYTQAEKVDPAAKNNADLHLNRATLVQYQELYHEALAGFSRAAALDPTWSEPALRLSQLLDFLRRLSGLVASKGKVKPKKQQAFIRGLRDTDLGPYGGGGHAAAAPAAAAPAAAADAGAQGGDAGGKAGQRRLALRALGELGEGKNEGVVLLGKVLFSLTTECSVPFVFGLLDARGACCAVSVYNCAPRWGVLIGDSVAVPEPSLRSHDIEFEREKFRFPCVRVTTPAALVVNGRQQGSSKQAAVTAVYSRRFL